MEDVTKNRNRLYEQARKNVVDHGRKTGLEHLIVLDAKTGEILETENGTIDGVILTDAIMMLINDGNNTVCLIHNHLKNLSFSMEDIIVATQLGVESIEAIGHNGAWYKARKKTTDIVDLEEKILDVNKETANQLGKLVSNNKIKINSAGNIYHHIVNFSLEKIGVINYEYRLSNLQEKMLIDLEKELNAIVNQVAIKILSTQLFKAGEIS